MTILIVLGRRPSRLMGERCIKALYNSLATSSRLIKEHKESVSPGTIVLDINADRRWHVIIAVTIFPPPDRLLWGRIW